MISDMERINVDNALHDAIKEYTEQEGARAFAKHAEAVDAKRKLEARRASQLEQIAKVLGQDINEQTMIAIRDILMREVPMSGSAGPFLSHSVHRDGGA